MASQGIKVVTKNKKAWHEYTIEETFEAGMELFGTEVKSIRQGAVNLKEAYCTIKDGELFIRQMHISPYEKGNIFNKDPMRVKKLLMHRSEIMRLLGKVKQEGYAIVPLQIYFKGSRVKVEIALAKGKKLHDKREASAKRDAEREIDRSLKQSNR